MEMSCEVTESAIFHPVDQIHISISSWIITTVIDIEPYKDTLNSVKTVCKLSKAITDRTL